MTVYPTSWARTLSDSHRRMLFEESGIDPPVTAERGAFTARRGKDVPQVHGKLPTKPGLVFPVHTLDARIFYRLRPDNPGRLPKYLQPKGHPNRLDVHPRQHERIKRAGGMRYVSEGEKKVDAGVSRGLLMVGLSGVWNGQKDKALIPDWYLLPLRGERYSILYDSDITANPNVQMAADRQARLLREQGAEVFITLLPPAADGSKQGLDDFFAAGGTVAELELLTRPYDLEIVERVRLTRDEKLRSAVEDLERRFWAEGWKGIGAHSARDVYLKLIEAARRHGKIHPDGIRVTKAQGPLTLEAKVSGRTLWKALNRLEDMGLIYRDNEGRKPDSSGAFVLRAGVSHSGEKPVRGGADKQAVEERASGDLHLRAPRQRWSSPPRKRQPRYGLVPDTRRIHSQPTTPTRIPDDQLAAVPRLGKIRGAILDALDDAGGRLTLEELCEVLHRKRPRDLIRRKASDKGRNGLLIWLEAAGILSVEGDAVSLTDDWLEALERETDHEPDERARRNYRRRRDGYRAHRAGVSTDSRRAIKRSREQRDAGIAAMAERAAAAAESEEQQRAEAFVRDRLRELGRIRLELLEDIWRDEGGDSLTIPAAVEALGYRVEELVEYDNERFVFAPTEAAA